MFVRGGGGGGGLISTRVIWGVIRYTLIFFDHFGNRVALFISELFRIITGVTFRPFSVGSI